MKSLIILVVFLFSSCGKIKTEKGNQYMTDMVYPVPYEAFSENPLTKDGKTMMLPVTGTISRGFITYHYENSEEGALKAGRELRNPYKSTEKVLEKGKALYGIYCLVCHGETGKGDGPIVPKFRNPPSYSSNTVSQLPEGRIFHTITKGKGMMPSHSVQLNVKERWFIVNYVKQLQKIK